MPYSNRLYEVDTNGRRSMRPVPEFKRSMRGNGTFPGKSARPAPPETTNAESFYYVKQMNAKTPMVIVLNDGEQIRGCIEWYDRTCIKVNREGAPNVLIQKHSIKYLFKEDEE